MPKTFAALLAILLPLSAAAQMRVAPAAARGVVAAPVTVVAPGLASSLAGPSRVSLSAPSLTAPAATALTASPLALPTAAARPVAAAALKAEAMPAATPRPASQPLFLSFSPSRTGGKTAEARRPKTLAAILKSLNAGKSAPEAVFDGSRRGSAEVVGRAFVLSKPGDARWLAPALAAARQSRTGRRILAKIEDLARRKGPIPIGTKRMGRNLAEYNYVEHTVNFSAYRNADPREVAAVLVHELTHVLQHDLGVPSDSVEFEMEAHIVTLRVLRELGLKPSVRPFFKETDRLARKDPQAFIDMIDRSHPGKLRLIGRSLADVQEQLEDEVDALEDDDGPLKAFVEDDLRRVSSPKGGARYRAFADRVMKYVRSYQRSFGTPR
ncbi:MAG: hypothetical protein HYZ75_16605 [Elusimicrobia bacterium]|nr:hypothetical protein [Elusimicrobiota bacterium]